MEFETGRRCPFKNDDSLTKPDIGRPHKRTQTPCGNTFYTLNRSARWGGYTIHKVANAKKNNKYRGAFHLLPFVISTCGEMGQVAQTLIRVLMEADVDG